MIQIFLLLSINAHCPCICNSQNLAITQMSIYRWWTDKLVVYLYNVILLNNKKEGTPDTCKAWTNLKIIMLSERSQGGKKYILCDLLRFQIKLWNSSQQAFSIKGQIISILGFASRKVSVANTQLCYYNMKAAIDNT